MTGLSSPAASTAITSNKIPAAGKRITRRELLNLLDRSHDFALTLLLAPAGSGKSTLLQQWQQHRSDLRSVLLGLDASDGDPVHFFRRLGEVLRQVVPQFDTVSYNPLSAEIALPAISVAESLEQAFAAVKGPLYVLLDDFQHARHPLIQQVMALLLERLPAHVHFVIASRIHPDFSLSRLKLEDRLLLLDAHDLRLATTQVQELAQQLEMSLDDDETAHLLTLTEGWMAGVKIALLAAARSGQSVLRAFNGQQPEVVDYFAHVVLRDLAPAMHDFVLFTAAFGQFNAALCDAVLERQDSARLIDVIASQGMFLQNISGRSGWYRYHPLFQDFLKTRLCIEMPERLEALHVATSEWLLSQNETEMALQHASECHHGHFRQCLREGCARWLRSGDYGAIIRWAAPLPDQEVTTDSDICFPLVGALIFSRRFNQARYYLDLIKEQQNRFTGRGRFMDDSTPMFLEVMLQLFQHETDFLLNADEEVLLSSCRHHDIRAFSLAMIAYHRLLHADFAQATQYALQAKTVLAQLGYDYLESYADLILIMSDRNTGNPVAATQRAESFMERYRDKPQNPAWINATLALSVVRYEQNRLENARRLCEDIMPLVNTACATEVIVTTYLTLSRLLSLHGEHTRAARLLLQLQRILLLGNYERFMGQVAFEEILQAYTRGHHDQIERIATQHQLPERLARHTWHTARDYEEGWERYGLAAALYLRHKGKLAEASQILAVLSATSRRCGVMARALIIDANRVVIQYLRGDQKGALQVQQQLIEEHGLICINRIVYDEAPGLVDIIRQAHARQQILLPEIYLQVFRDSFRQDAAESSQETVNSVNMATLTTKEMEILELLQQGLSNNEISQATGVALSTTKWHLKNIFAKLGVANRTAAILRASQRSALSAGMLFMQLGALL